METNCIFCGYRIIISRPDSGNDIRCPDCGRTFNILNGAEQGHSIDIKERKVSKSFPTIRQAMILIVALYALILLFAIPIGILIGATGMDRTKGMIIESLFSFVAFAVIVFAGYRKTQEPFGNVFPLKPFSPALVLPLFLAVGGSTIILSDVDNLVRMVMPAPDWLMKLFADLYSNPAAAIVTAVIVAPVTEEFFCRGLILHGFLKNYSINKAVISSAIAFTIMHLNPWQFAGAFFYGLLFAWLLIKTQSLWLPLIGHATANFMPLLILDILKLNIPGFSDTSIFEPLLQPWWFDLAGLFIGAVGFIWLVRSFGDLAISGSKPMNSTQAS